MRIKQGGQQRRGAKDQAFKFLEAVVAADANSVSYLGLPTNTRPTLSGNRQVMGAIHAPNANFTLVGCDAEIYDFVRPGATKSLVLTGHYNFHDDAPRSKVGLMWFAARTGGKKLK